MEKSQYLHGTERTPTKTNDRIKSAENTSFCNYSSFILSLSISLNIKHFSTELLFNSFSLVTSRDTVRLIFPNTVDVDFSYPQRGLNTKTTISLQ